MGLLDVLTSNIVYARNALRGNWVDDPEIFERCTPEHPPVLLLHGFLGTRGIMMLTEQRLTADGRVAFSVDLGPLNIKDIRKSAYRIHVEVDRILEAAGGKFEQIDVVGHSMGGLIGLYYAQAMGGHDRIRKLITLGTPWRGTWLAMAGVAALGLVSPSTWQMLPGSQLVRDMEDTKVPLYVELTSIYGQFDAFCPPATASRQDCANYRVPFGHAGLTVSHEVYRIIARQLRRPHQPGRDAGVEFALEDGVFAQRRLDGAPGVDESDPFEPPRKKRTVRGGRARSQAANGSANGAAAPEDLDGDADSAHSSSE